MPVSSTVSDLTAPIVQNIVINGGEIQRTNTRRIDLQFSEAVNLAPLIASGAVVNVVRLHEKGSGVPLVWLNAPHMRWDAAANRLGIDLTVDGPGGSDATRLPNGRYELRIETAQVLDASANPLADSDGVDDGRLTIDHASGSSTFDFFQLGGDLDGDADTDVSDLGVLASGFGSSDLGDCDGDGDTDHADLAILAGNYGVSLPKATGRSIVLTRGGTYSGIWESHEHGIPAVTIRTSERVRIENSTIRSRDDLIQTDVTGADIEVRNTRGYGLNPNIAGVEPGRFAKIERFRRAVLENNYLEGTSGIYLFDYRGDRSLDQSIRIVGNQALNIDGRKSDGNGGFLDFNKRVRRSDGLTEYGFKRVQFVQLNLVQGVPGIEIAWNEVLNEPGKSRVEDNISIYRSGGTAQSPIAIHDNYIHGAYTIKPWQDDHADATWSYEWDYSGGGIMLGDGADSSYVIAYRNQVIATTNYGIAIYAGHHMQFYDNRVLSSGLLSDGRAITAQNVGVYIWDGLDAGANSFYENSAHDNLVGWVRAGARNDWWVPDATSFVNNVNWPDPITLLTEAAELAHWQTKLIDAGISIGPRS